MLLWSRIGHFKTIGAPLASYRTCTCSRRSITHRTSSVSNFEDRRRPWPPTFELASDVRARLAELALPAGTSQVCACTPLFERFRLLAHFVGKHETQAAEPETQTQPQEVQWPPAAPEGPGFGRGTGGGGRPQEQGSRPVGNSPGAGVAGTRAART